MAGGDEYGLMWPGKAQAQAEAEARTSARLVPNRNASLEWEDTGNLVIEGDNLVALKCLEETLANQVGMIYIDPPYNTGKDFVFRDDFRQKNDTRGTDFVQRHAGWLSMMYPRLVVGKRLLAPTGAMFVSIDDHEVAHLQLIMREIFGEDNVETLVWDKEAEGKSGTLRQIRTVRRVHEYVVVGYRDRSATQFRQIREPLPGKEGELQTANLAVNKALEKSDHPNYFTITNPAGDSFTRQWKWDEEKITALIDQGLIYWGKDGRRQPRLIIPTDERRLTYLRSILPYGGTTVGRKDVERHFQEENTDPHTGRLKDLAQRVSFDYPKPVILLRKLIETATARDDIVLDFFAGSGSTAEAVLEANARDGGKRRHISVQLPEPTVPGSPEEKLGYFTLVELTRERIRRAGARIREDYAAELRKRAEPLDTGFRALTVEP